MNTFKGKDSRLNIFYVFIAFQLLLLSSCEDVIEIKLKNTDPVIVIEAIITDEPEPCQVKITKSTDYFNPSDYDLINEAIVTIANNDGKKDTLDYTDKGYYYSNNISKTEGDTFPLGIIDKAEYQDTSLRLQPGDRVVFCTDGIVEALNNQKKMFSFERLQKVVQGSKSTTAEALLKDIIDSIYEFAGDAEQYDDMTIIVLQAAELQS